MKFRQAIIRKFRESGVLKRNSAIVQIGNERIRVSVHSVPNSKGRVRLLIASDCKDMMVLPEEDVKAAARCQ